MKLTKDLVVKVVGLGGAAVFRFGLDGVIESRVACTVVFWGTLGVLVVVAHMGRMARSARSAAR